MNKKYCDEVEVDFEEGTMVGNVELISAKGTGTEIGRLLREIHYFQERHSFSSVSGQKN